jgi:hypothetical protein
MSDYQQKAVECLRVAKKLHGPAERLEMIGIARFYMALAASRLQRQEPSQLYKTYDLGRLRLAEA